MVKIIFVITQGQTGGAQRYVLDLAKSLDQTAYQILVLVGAEKPDLKTRLEQNGIRVKVAKHLVRNLNLTRDFLAIWELRKLMQEFKPDAVHLNSTKAGILGSLAGRLARVKHIIFTAHGFAFLEPHNWFVRQIYFWAEKFATRFRTKIICVSGLDRQAAIKTGLCASEKLVTIHNGISPMSVIASLPKGDEAISSLFGIASPPVADRNDEKIIIGTIANLYPTKGIKYLIAAAKLVTAKFAMAKFVIIGDGPERAKLNLQLTTYNLQQRVTLAGSIPEASRYLSNFDIFVLPSIKEGFPYAILEAMAAGLPIVATSVGGIPEIITPSEVGVGILVPPKNPQALAEAIITLIRNPNLARTLGQNAREKVKDFSLERMVRETEEVYPAPSQNIPQEGAGFITSKQS